MTTHDTPEAALAAALKNDQTVKALTIRLGRFNDAWWNRFARDLLAALDGWTLVRGGGDVIERGIELARQQEAEIARLRAALTDALHQTPAVAEMTLRDALAPQEASDD
jgi:hypothetical protein